MKTKSKKDYITVWLPPIWDKKLGVHKHYCYGSYRIELTAHWKTKEGKKCMMYTISKNTKRSIDSSTKKV